MTNNRKTTVFFLFLFLLCFLNVSRSFSQAQGQDLSSSRNFFERLKGKFEIEIHYSQWTLDFVKGIFESELRDRMGEEIGKEISKYLDNSHVDLERTTYEQELTVDTGGFNYGFELRFYPDGKNGSFSFGLSFEKTKMRLSTIGSVRQGFKNNTYAEVEAEGYIRLNPMSTNLSLRWDTKPNWIVTPYIVIGLGLAVLNGEVSYDYEGSYHSADAQERVKDSSIQSLKEFEESIDFNLPNVLPILQLNLGLRGEIFPFLHLRAEVGFWDGFLLRFGIAYRF